MRKHFTPTRIIGIILLIIALLVYFSKRPGTTSLAIAGLILIIAPKKYAQTVFDKYIQTFQKWKRVIITAFYDALYWLLVFGGVYYVFWIVQAKALVIKGIGMTQEELINPAVASQSAEAIKQLAVTTVTYGAILTVLFYIAYTISRTLIWTTITEQKLNKKFFLRFAGLNGIWWTIWIPIFLALVIGLKGNPNSKDAVAALFAIASYFSPIMHTLYMKTHKTGYSIGNGIGFGFSKIHKLILPYTLVFITYIILYQAYRPFEQSVFVKPISMLFVVLFMAWVRTYQYEVIKDFK
jgi:hypothetical protein